MKFTILNEKATVPVRATKESAGYDLCSIESLVIRPGKSILIKTGIGWDKVPSNVVGYIQPRSGHAYKNAIDTLAGVIDSDYINKDIGVILINHGKIPFKINAGDKIAQLVLHEFFVMPEETKPTTKRIGGYGSTS